MICKLTLLKTSNTLSLFLSKHCDTKKLNLIYVYGFSAMSLRHQILIM